MENFTPIRNGLLDHALAGKLSPFDFGLYVFMIMRADYSTGIYQGCAMTIAYQFGDPSLKEHIQRALRRLRDKRYVNYRNGDGSRGAYPILINKFSVTVGGLSGKRLNAWKHNGLVRPEYDAKNGDETVEPQWSHSEATVEPPNKDLKTIRLENKPSPPSAVASPSKALEVIEIWNQAARGTNLPSARLTTKRQKVILARLKEKGWLEEFVTACTYVRSSNWHRGQNDSNWFANVDFLLQPDKATELAEKAKAKPSSGTNGKAMIGNAADTTLALLKESGAQ